MKRDSSIELLRIIAMFFVVFNHTWNNGWTLFATYPVGSFRFFIYMPIAVFCKFSVPVYFMISGAVLLGKEELDIVVKKRIVRMIIVLFTISVLYFFYDILIGNTHYSDAKQMIVVFLKNIISGSTKYNLGFLYSYIIFLVILPFLRTLVKYLEKHYYSYIFVISAAFMFLVPLVEQYLFIGTKMFSACSLLTTNIIIYPIIGYYFFKISNVKKMNTKRFLVAWCFNVLCIVISCVLTYIRILKTNETDINHVQAFFNSFVIINGTVMFITFLRIRISNESIRRVINKLGGFTFGIYLLHPFFMDNSNYSQLQRNLFVCEPMLSEIIYCLFVVVLCAVITYILKLIPVIKKYI